MLDWNVEVNCRNGHLRALIEIYFRAELQESLRALRLTTLFVSFSSSFSSFSKVAWLQAIADRPANMQSHLQWTGRLLSWEKKRAARRFENEFVPLSESPLISRKLGTIVVSCNDYCKKRRRRKQGIRNRYKMNRRASAVRPFSFSFPSRIFASLKMKRAAERTKTIFSQWIDHTNNN